MLRIFGGLFLGEFVFSCLKWTHEKQAWGSTHTVFLGNFTISLPKTAQHQKAPASAFLSRIKGTHSLALFDVALFFVFAPTGLLIPA